MVRFSETQRFRQPWLWAILLGALGASLLTVPTGVGLVIVLLVAGVLAFFAAARLETEVRDRGVFVRLYPLQRSFRRIEFSDVTDYEAISYDPIREYGGWGIRWRLAGPGTAYSVGGDRGVLFERRDAAPLLIGTRRPGEFVAALDSVAPGRG